MKKVLVQELRSGQIKLIETCPTGLSDLRRVAVKAENSLISIGTERMLSEFGTDSWLKRIKKHPDQVEKVINKIRRSGFRETINAVDHKLRQLLPVGYANAGVVDRVYGDGWGFKKNDRVLTNCCHGEYVFPQRSYCLKIPDRVALQDAPFAIPGAIVLNALRLCDLGIGSRVLVIGLGLLGKLSALVLSQTHGCFVAGNDKDNARAEEAEALGLIHYVDRPSGIEDDSYDAVIICTNSDDSSPLQHAISRVRYRGTVVLVGTAGASFNRNAMYHKECTFKVSRSYGPGRYDLSYEESGPRKNEFRKRWTASDNIEAFLLFLDRQQLNLGLLKRELVRFDDAESEYRRIMRNANSTVDAYIFEFTDSKEKSIDKTQQASPQNGRRKSTTQAKVSKNRILIIGAGSHVQRSLVPAIQSFRDSEIVAVVSQNGVSAADLSNKLEIPIYDLPVADIISKNDVNKVIIASDHRSHGEYLLNMLDTEIDIFIEKPITISLSEAEEIQKILRNRKNLNIVTGYNRKYSKHAIFLKQRFESDPHNSFISIVVCADPINTSIKNQDLVTGGRFVGEVCHFVDLICFIASIKSSHLQITACGSGAGTVSVAVCDDKSLKGNIMYIQNSAKNNCKEDIRLHNSQTSYVLTDWKKLEDMSKFWPRKVLNSDFDKGRKAIIERFLKNLSTDQLQKNFYDELLIHQKILMSAEVVGI